MIRNILAGLGLILAFGGTADAADTQKITQETMRVTTDPGGQITLAWWMPTEFWDSAMAKNPAVSAPMRDQVHVLMDEYVVFSILRTTFSLGGTNAATREDMLHNAHFEANGQTVEPLAPTNVKPGVQAMMGALKPLIGSMLGSFGQSFEFVFYENYRNGRRLVNAQADGNLKYVLFDKTFTWRLPLASLLPPKHDPRTGEEFPGNFEFNPYTGNRLIAR